MNAATLEHDLRESFCREIRLHEDGPGRYRVFTPFQFADGDHPTILLQVERDRLFLTDEGRTFLRLAYDIDERELRRGNRQKIIADTLAFFNVEERDGELIRWIEGAPGDALRDFAQAMLKVSDVSFLNRELVYSTFVQDFREVVAHSSWGERATFGWHHSKHDPKGKYPVDCVINGLKRPIFIYALTSDDSVRDAHISLLEFERWNLDFHSIGLFEDSARISRRVYDRFADVCEKTYSSLEPNRERFLGYIARVVANQSQS
jgi:hypothetical protein